jgi:hypothetical protein
MATQIGEGRDRFFLFDDGTPTSWTIPPHKLDEWIASLRAKVQEEAAPPTPTKPLTKKATALHTTGVMSPGSAAAKVSSSDRLDEKIDEEMPWDDEDYDAPWVVKIDPSSGAL